MWSEQERHHVPKGNRRQGSVHKFPLQRDLHLRLLPLPNISPRSDTSRIHPLPWPLQVRVWGRKLQQEEEDQGKWEEFQRRLAESAAVQLGQQMRGALGKRTKKMGGQAERTDSGEELGVIAEAMGINPTPHSPKTDSGTGRTGTEVGRRDHGLSGTG